jgi:hypothetical protein
MSLTEEAYRERKWESFPALRQALEDKKTPSDYFGLTSAHDNRFEAMARLFEISILAIEYRNHIKETAQSVGKKEMYQDLKKLELYLERTIYPLKRAIDEVETIYTAL